MYVAFDMDNTLGYFEVVGPLAYFMCPEFLENPEESKNNRLEISKRLRSTLARVRKTFAMELLKDGVVETVLRPNLTSMIRPCIKAKATVILYSNTGNTFSTHLAKDLIEHKFKAPGLIKLVADVFHPLRHPETQGARGADGFLNPDKTYPVLMTMLQSVSHASIHPDEVAFVDDRDPVHRIAEAVPLGLTYIKPTAFAPRMGKRSRQRILEIGLYVMDRAGLLSDMEYMSSAICYRVVQGRTIRGFPDLLSYVWERMNETYFPPSKWVDDTIMIEGEIGRFFQRG